MRIALRLIGVLALMCLLQACTCQRDCRHSSYRNDAIQFELTWEGYVYTDNNSVYETEFLINQEYVGVGLSGAARCLLILSKARDRGYSIKIQQDDAPLYGQSYIDPFRALGLEDILYDIMDGEVLLEF